MIPLFDPADLPETVAAFRASRGLSRIAIADKIARDEGRFADSVRSQVAEWERRAKSPQLASLGPYLRGHRLILLVAATDDHTTDITPWCRAADRRGRRCAVVAGHGGEHRDYAGLEFG